MSTYNSDVVFVAFAMHTHTHNVRPCACHATLSRRTHRKRILSEKLWCLLCSMRCQCHNQHTASTPPHQFDIARHTHPCRRRPRGFSLAPSQHKQPSFSAWLSVVRICSGDGKCVYIWLCVCVCRTNNINKIALARAPFWLRPSGVCVCLRVPS